MEDFTLAELGVFLGVVGGIITSLLLTIQKSKCEKIKCCGNECIRPSKKTTADEENVIPPNPQIKISYILYG